MGCAQSRELGVRTFRLPGFILLLGFSGTFLVVSIFDMGRFCSPGGVIDGSCQNYGSLLACG